MNRKDARLIETKIDELLVKINSVYIEIAELKNQRDTIVKLNRITNAYSRRSVIDTQPEADLLMQQYTHF